MDKNASELISNYISELYEVYANFPSTKIIELSKLLLEDYRNCTVYTIGNGGSATTASHMATDLGVGSLRRSNPIRCISLVENMGVITATSNDQHFNSVFSQQIKLLGRPRDILICFSASGNSPNLLEAVTEAKKIGVYTVGVTGFDGGQLRDICDFSVHTPTNIGSYGVVEDIHLSVSHVLTEIIRNS